MKTQCPHCLQIYSNVEPEQINQPTECLKCKKAFVIHEMQQPAVRVATPKTDPPPPPPAKKYKPTLEDSLYSMCKIFITFVIIGIGFFSLIGIFNPSGQARIFAIVAIFHLLSISCLLITGMVFARMARNVKRITEDIDKLIPYD